MRPADRGPQKMLLCIDDSPAVLEYEKRIFEQSGYIVATTGSARVGLRLATLFSFDAVLVDFQMPEMNGHEFAHEMKRLKPGTPVVMFSGSDVPEETRQLVDAVVPKGGARSELLPTITRICEGGIPQ